MRLLTPKLIHKVGLPPGSLVHVGDARVEDVTITMFDYSVDVLVETAITDTSALEPAKRSDTVTWINVDGIHDAATIKEFGDYFQVHPPGAGRHRQHSAASESRGVQRLSLCCAQDVLSGQ